MAQKKGGNSGASKLFIIGSGFTHSVTSTTAPLNCKLFSTLRNSAVRTCDKKFWEEFTQRYATEDEDIEIALTRLDLDIARKPKNMEEFETLRLNVEARVADYFRQFCFREKMLTDCPWLEKFVRGTFSEGDAIISLNYDCLIEGLLDRFGLWSPEDGYGNGFRKFSDLFQTPKFSPSPIKVLKIHGSENFYRTPAVLTSGRGISPINKCMDFTVDASRYPVSGQNINGPFPWEGSSDAIIAPSFVKTFPSTLLCLMVEAFEHAQRAETLVVIGCGLRPEDGFLYLLLWRFVQGLVEPGSKRRIVILDPKASDLCEGISAQLEYDLSKVMRPIDKSLEDGWSDLVKEL